MSEICFVQARNTKVPPPSALPPAPDSSLLLAAATHYRSVLKHDPNNVYAALGVGAVLATREQRAEARECLSIVRETGLLSAMNAADQLSDAWLNLAHVLVEQNQLPAAIKLYTKCSSQCFQNRDVQVLLFLARAQYKNQQWIECKRTIARALFLTPSSDLLWYDFAIAQSEFAFHVISEPTTRTLHDMESAVAELAQAEKHFRRLSTLPSSHVSRDKALIHARHCKENISVAMSHLEHDRKRAEQALLQREAAAAARLEVERRRRAEQELLLEQQRQQKERVQEGAVALQRQVADIISRAGTKSKKSQENSADEVAPEVVNDVSALPQLKERVGELEKQVEVEPEDQDDDEEEAESSDDDLFEEAEEEAGAESETEAPSAAAVESNAGKRKLDEESDGEAEMGTTAMTTSNNNDNTANKKRRLQRKVAVDAGEETTETPSADDTPSDVGRKRAVIDDDDE
jgi:RNA polymerase-associated protein CTR9